MTETEGQTDIMRLTETNRHDERERERDFRLQMVCCILAIGPYTNRKTQN